MISDDTTVQFVTWDRPAPIEKAKEHYKQKSLIPFNAELEDYLHNGVVISRPTCFGMARVVNLAKTGEPRLAWFVRYACGNLDELLSTIPAELPEIAFCRRVDGRLRIYSFKRMIELARKNII